MGGTIKPQPAAQPARATPPAPPTGAEAYGAPLSAEEQANPVPPPKAVSTSSTMPPVDSSRVNPDPMRTTIPNTFAGGRALGLDGSFVNTDQAALDQEQVRAKNAVPKSSPPTAAPPIQAPETPAVAQPSQTPEAPAVNAAPSKIMALAAPAASTMPDFRNAPEQESSKTPDPRLANAPTSLPGMPPPGPMPGTASAAPEPTIAQAPTIKPGQPIKPISQPRKSAVPGSLVTNQARKPQPKPGYNKAPLGRNGLPLGQLGANPLRKISAENISHEAFTEGVTRELVDYLDKQAELQKEAEQEYMLVLRSDLTKMAIELGEDSPYSSEDIYRFTESAESFNKAASEEAQLVWAGLSDELMKAGADQDFLDGMLKEAAPWGAMLRNPGAALQAAVKAFGGGGAKATEEALNLAKKAPAFGGITTNTGELLTNAATMPEHLSGSTRFKFTNALEDILGKKGPISPAAQESLDAAKTKYMDKIKGQLGTNAEDAFQTNMHDIYRKAKVAPGATATTDQLAHQGYIDQMAGGDFSHIAGPGRLNVHPDVLNSKLNPGVLNDAKTWASQASGAKHDYTGVTPYSQYMNETARNLTPPGGGKDPSFMGVKFRPMTGFNRAMAGGAAGTLLGMPFGVAPITGAIGTGLGALTGTFGTAPVVAAGALGTAGLVGTGGYLGYKGVKGVANNLGLGGQDTQTRDMTGELRDRHRIVPFMNNRATGAIGGALLASLIANHSGYSGPLSWLIPILGGVAGYHYLPQMMNKWKDPYGVGENAINPLAANMNQMHPLGQ